MSDTVTLDGELSLTNVLDGEAGTVIEVGHGTGIDTIVFNSDYTLTFNMSDGSTFTTGSIRGEQGQQGAKGEQGDDYVLTAQDKQDIANLVPAPEVPVEDVQINGTSILTDGVANIPPAKAGTLGLVKMGQGLSVNAEGALFTQYADPNRIKAENTYYMPITPVYQHVAAFYGLAHAAGDTTQKTSSNAVGTYTEDAKSAISDMLNGSVSVSGTTPTIVAKSGIRYVCGEIASLDFTPPASGICDVVFTSGSTPTVLTVPSTVKWANGFDPSNLDANTTYELNIMDGLGVCGTWT